jgi:predicted KAP-like P-loop ATPase
MSLLRRLNSSRRFQTLDDAVAKGAAIATMVDIVFDLGREHGKYNSQLVRPESDRLLASEELQWIERSTLERIRHAAREDMLIDVPMLGHVLYRWRDWAGETEPQEWAQRHIETDTGLLRILEAFQGQSSGTRGIRFFFDPRVLQPFVDPDSVIERVRSLQSGSALTEIQRTVTRTFVDGYANWKQGRDPTRIWDD